MRDPAPPTGSRSRPCLVGDEGEHALPRFAFAPRLQVEVVDLVAEAPQLPHGPAHHPLALGADEGDVALLDQHPDLAVHRELRPGLRAHRHHELAHDWRGDFF